MFKVDNTLVQTICADRAIYDFAHHFPFWDSQLLLAMRQEELRYHYARADEINKAQSIDNQPTLLHAQSVAPMVEPQVRTKVVFDE